MQPGPMKIVDRQTRSWNDPREICLDAIVARISPEDKVVAKIGGDSLTDQCRWVGNWGRFLGGYADRSTQSQGNRCPFNSVSDYLSNKGTRLRRADSLFTIR